MIIASLHKRRNFEHQFQIEVNHQTVKREKRQYKYLGVEID